MKKLFGVLFLLFSASYALAGDNVNYNALFPSGVWSQYSVGNSTTNFGKDAAGFRINSSNEELRKAIVGKPGEFQRTSGVYQNADGRTLNSFAISAGDCPKGKGFACVSYYSASVNPVSSEYQLVRYNSTTPESSTLTSCTPDFDEKSTTIKEPKLNDCYTVEKKSCEEFLNKDFDQFLQANLGGAEAAAMTQQCDRINASLQSIKGKINAKFRASQKFVEPDLLSSYDTQVANNGLKATYTKDSKLTPIKYSENNTFALLEYVNKVKASCVTANTMRIFDTKAETERRSADQKAYLKALFADKSTGAASGAAGAASSATGRK